MPKATAFLLPTKVKSRPARAKFVTFSDFDPGEGTTLDQVADLIDVYTHVSPILPGYAVGALVPDLDLLAADINDHWQLQGQQRFFRDEIEATWSVIYLAAYVDLKIAEAP